MVSKLSPTWINFLSGRHPKCRLIARYLVFLPFHILVLRSGKLKSPKWFLISLPVEKIFKMCRGLFLKKKTDSVFLLSRMEDSGRSPPQGSMAESREDGEKSAGQLSESARLPRHREHRPKSPRRHPKGTKLQRRMGDHEQLSWDADQRGLPGQREHSESSGSPSEPMEISPKRWARGLASWPAVPLVPVRCPGREVIVWPLAPPSVTGFFSTSQESSLPTWTLSSHSLRT